MELIAVIRQDEDGRYSAEVPGLSGCYSGGETIEAAEANIAEAVEAWLDEVRDRITAESDPSLPSLWAAEDVFCPADTEDKRRYNSLIFHNYAQAFADFAGVFPIGATETSGERLAAVTV